MKQVSKILFSFVFLILVSSSAWATYVADITYDFNSSGNHYIFTYVVNNISTDPSDIGPLDFFLINFDADAFTAYDNIHMGCRRRQCMVERCLQDPGKTGSHSKTGFPGNRGGARSGAEGDPG